MALKHVNAVVVGAGAGGGIVAKELSTAGLSVVLLERGKWYTAFDCRKDDLRNQRTTVLGNAFGPDEERNPRVFLDEQGREHLMKPSDAGYNNNAACVGGGTASYGAMAWRFMEKDFRMRSTYGTVEGSTLEDWPISYTDLEPYYEKAEWEVGLRPSGRKRRKRRQATKSDAGLRKALFGHAAEAGDRAAAALRLSTARHVQYGAELALAMAADAVRAQTRIEKLADDLDKRFPEDTLVQFNYLPTVRAQLGT